MSNRRILCAIIGALSVAAVCSPSRAGNTEPGSIDSSFAPSLGTSDAVNAVAVQRDGKLVVAGRFTAANGVVINRVARFNGDGSLDSNFFVGSGADAEIFATAIQPDGRILVAGRFTNFNGIARSRICRLNVDGSVDATFGVATDINGTPFAISVQRDGRIVVAGRFSLVNGALRFNVVRLLIDGSLDPSFDPGTGPNSDVRAVGLRADDRIVLGGNFTSYNGVARGGVAEVFADGSLDPSFDPGSGTGGNVNALLVQPDGAIVLGGRFVQFAGINRSYLARVNANGSLDLGFAPLPNDWVNALALQCDGRIVVGGLFTNVNGISLNRIARLHRDGTVDTSFNPGTGFTGSSAGDATQVRALAFQPAGRIAAVGVFDNYAGFARANVALLFDGSSSRFTTFTARAHVFTEDRILKSNFSIAGPDAKQLLIRVLGPTLAGEGIVMPLADPKLELRNENGVVFAKNDNWQMQKKSSRIAATGFAPPNPLEPALLVTLPPGVYTAIVRGKSTTNGVARLEIYDLDKTPDSQLTTDHSRGFVGTGDDKLVGGVTIRDNGDPGSKTCVLLRAAGPSLQGQVTNPLDDPVITLRDSSGNVIATNEDWRDSEPDEIFATGYAPTDDREAAILAHLEPGTYTATVTGKNGDTGIGTIEFYQVE